jgi:hypothetical protein
MEEYGESRHNSAILDFGSSWEVNGQLYAPASLTQVHVGTLWSGERSCPCRELNLGRPTHSLPICTLT